MKLGEAIGDDATKPVRVNMEEGDVGEETDLNGEVSGDILMIEVNSCDDVDRRVIKGPCTKDPVVGTDIRANPVAGEIFWVRVDGPLPGLESNVGSLQPGVFDGYIYFNIFFIVIW